ncbi:MAG TPA: hypothetical protein VFN57_01470 [Thermomicrobiaceae bacterium]|nr:hypothetical protein [Thermomicrobiaceae bacterium]
MDDHDHDHEDGDAHEPEQTRWVCDCTHPPVLLAIYDASGRIEIKVRHRQYVATGRLEATCPRCGTHHVLDVRRQGPPAG